jgi:hypothetical protein
MVHFGHCTGLHGCQFRGDVVSAIAASTVRRSLLILIVSRKAHDVSHYVLFRGKFQVAHDVALSSTTHDVSHQGLCWCTFQVEHDVAG